MVERSTIAVRSNHFLGGRQRALDTRLPWMERQPMILIHLCWWRPVGSNILSLCTQQNHLKGKKLQVAKKLVILSDILTKMSQSVPYKPAWLNYRIVHLFFINKRLHRMANSVLQNVSLRHKTSHSLELILVWQYLNQNCPLDKACLTYYGFTLSDVNFLIQN